MLLRVLLQDYVESHDLERASQKPIRAAIRSYSEHLRQPAQLADLQPKPVNKWLLEEVERVSRRTAKNYRASIITLWRWAYEIEELTDVPPMRVRRIRAPQPIVEAYTTDEVERLLGACDLLSNRFCPRWLISRKLLYRAIIYVSWHTGFRPNDVVEHLKWSNIADNGCVRIIQHKTKKEVTRWIDQDAMGALESIRVDALPTVFAQHTCLETWRSVFRELKKTAGITRGTPKWLRRSVATRTMIDHGEEAAELALGQVTRGLARKSYIDQSQILHQQLRMPRLKRPKKRQA